MTSRGSGGDDFSLRSEGWICYHRGSLFSLLCFQTSRLICVVWVVTILYGEMVAYWVPSLWSYSWPYLHHNLTLSCILIFFKG
ncbi:hypothetical protein CsatB_023353 [Cannabis sativa]